MTTRRKTRRRPVAKSVRRVGNATSYPSHPRVGLHPSQTRRTRCKQSGNFGDPSQGSVSYFETAQ